MIAKRRWVTNDVWVYMTFRRDDPCCLACGWTKEVGGEDSEAEATRLALEHVCPEGDAA